MGVLLLFIDGLGLGKKDPQINPCATGPFNILSRFEDDAHGAGSKQGLLVPTEATLGIEGLPQSATGQATILTGINCAKALGRHLQGFPNEILRGIIKQHSLLKKIREMGLKPAFINVFRPLYFKLPDTLQWRLSATTVVNKAAGLPFFTLDHLKNREAIYHDMTNDSLVARGFEVNRFSLKEAAEVLVRSLDRFDFVLYEYFLTDMAGHSRQMERAQEEIAKLDTFLTHLLKAINLQEHLIVLTSDHGNIEDIRVKTHTKNRVFTLLWGRNAESVSRHIRTLEDITPALLDALT